MEHCRGIISSDIARKQSRHQFTSLSCYLIQQLPGLLLGIHQDLDYAAALLLVAEAKVIPATSCPATYRQGYRQPAPIG
jgi:hypothetical protein